MGLFNNRTTAEQPLLGTRNAPVGNNGAVDPYPNETTTHNHGLLGGRRGPTSTTTAETDTGVLGNRNGHHGGILGNNRDTAPIDTTGTNHTGGGLFHNNRDAAPVTGNTTTSTNHTGGGLFNNNRDAAPVGAGTGTTGLTGTNHHSGGMLSRKHDASPVGTTQTHTGPAPLAGVQAHGDNALHTGVNDGTHDSSTSAGLTGMRATRQANGLARKAKVENVVGDLTCSSSMKARAHNHALQADHLRMQGSEMSEAERLEAEAGMRRQRAVGLGAHPSHATGTTGVAAV